MNPLSLLKNKYVLIALAALAIIFIIITLLTKIFWWVAVPVIIVGLIFLTLGKVTSIFTPK